MTIGFIGQGFIGKSYADDMERRGHEVVRYSLEEPYKKNKHRIKLCGIVFIAVPTPTTPKGFDYSIVRGALKLLAPSTTAVIKSTVLPGTTKILQKEFPKLFVMHSPEFLVLKQAAEDAARPLRNIIGIPKRTLAFKNRAKEVLKTLPHAPFELICDSPEAELIKYGGNFFLYLKVLYANIMFDASKMLKADYAIVAKAIGADPRIGPSHLKVLHNSGHRGGKTGRGAGGVCFIKDMEAFARLYAEMAKDPAGSAFVRAAIEKNKDLLTSSSKDLDLLAGVYKTK